MTVFNTTSASGAVTTPTGRKSRAKTRPSARPRQTGKGRARASSGRTESISRKRCVDCKKQKPAKAFLPTTFGADGLTDKCKVCTFAAAERDRLERESRRREAETRKQARKPAPAGATTKVCKSCNVAKALDQYGKHARSRDGHLHVCRSCNSKSRAKSRASISKEDLASAHEKHLAGNHAAVKRWQAKNYAATLAQSAVHKAVEQGIIAKPRRCQVRGCKTTRRLEAHHFSYSVENALSVVWLCRPCHASLHKGGRLKLVVGLPPLLATAPETKSKRTA